MAFCRDRRAFLRVAGIATLTPMTSCQTPPKTLQNGPRVVVVGGGFGGATAAKYLRMLDDGIRVTLIEPKSHYMTCPGSNWLLAGLLPEQTLWVDYHHLEAYGVDVVTDAVAAIEPDRRSVRLSGGGRVGFDRLVMSPGIALRWNEPDGYTEAVARQIPHAWQAGSQTRLLLQQLQAMPDGGTVLLSVPAEPYRCPPGPYERASLIAYYLQQVKPKSKVVILDAKSRFSKQALFEAGWRRHFGYGTAQSLIEWHAMEDNRIVALDPVSKTLFSDFGDRFNADVLNVIPAQQAGDIARQTGLTDRDGWCPVEPLTSESTLISGIHVLGDAARFEPMPKSAFSAVSQAKACAAAVVAILGGKDLPEPNWINTCYSLVTPEHGISIAMVYKLDAERKLSAVPGAGGVSPIGDQTAQRLEARHARDGYRSITADAFGSNGF